ncbi:MAG TPA: hypothetical protein VIH76_15090 [Candidatus Acidoferrales bacterium]
MSDHDKDAIILKLATERADMSKQIALLRARLKEISVEYQRISYALANAPEKLVVMGGTTDVSFICGELIPTGKWLERSQVLDLVRQLRVAMTQEAELVRQLANLGVPPNQT